MNILKKHTPGFLKIQYHKLKFLFESLCLFLIYGIKSYKLNGHYSQHGQDEFLDKVLNIKKELSAIVEVGANRPELNSNSKYFDNHLNIISIDPIDYSVEYRNQRPYVKFINVGIDAQECERIFFQVENVVGWENQMSSFNKPDQRFKWVEKIVKVKRLSSIINDNYDVINGDYLLMMDVEGWEMQVLKSMSGLQENRYPKYILIECSALNFNLISALKDMGYLIHSRVGWTDSLFIRKKDS